MSRFALRCVMLGTCASSSAALLLAPIAAAEIPDTPQPGSENAAATIADLTDLGYGVQVNWANGHSAESLSNCHVNNVNTVSGDTAYVDVVCPQ